MRSSSVMIGARIGNFGIVAKLGQGGMGEVFLGEHEKIHTRVAIKMLLPHISAHKDHVERFFNEAIAVGKIQHAGIAKIFDVGFTEQGRAYLVMEYLDGESLAKRIHDRRRLPLPMVADIGRQIAGVLEAVHKAGITHRDLKPDNIFLVGDSELASGERVKILDFGIAKLGGQTSAGLTATGSMGTPGYMSPEQWKNSKLVDWRTDAYSLGCLTFEMLTGRPPFVAESIGEACAKHLTELPPRASSLVAVPPQLDELIESLLAKQPEERPASMKLIGSTIAAAASSSVASTIAPPPPPPQARRAPGAPAPAPVSTTLGSATGARVVSASDGAMVAAAAHTMPAGGNRRLALVLGGAAAALAVVVTVLVLALSSRSTPAPPERAAVGSVDAAPPPPNPGDQQALRSQEAALATLERDLGELDTSLQQAIDALVAAKTEAEHAAAKARIAQLRRRRGELASQLEGVQRNVASLGGTVIAKPHAEPIVPDVPVPAAKVAGGTIAKASPVEAVTRPAEAQEEAPTSSGSCDEVSCVLNNYEGRCCAKFRKSGAGGARAEGVRKEPASGVPESLDRGMISAGVAGVKGRISACGDKSSAKGTVKISVKVSPDGSVSSVTVKESPDPALGSCVAGAMQRAKFARTASGGSFGYPFKF